MNIALLAQSAIFTPIQHWLQRSVVKQSSSRSEKSGAQKDPKFVAACAVSTRATAQKHQQHKPLRVVRVVDAGQAHSSVGRMVISGRMADVCAELDRLAAREAAAT